MLILFAAAPNAHAVIINIPAGQPTIQMARSAANPGDEIVIAPGLYSNDAYIEFTASVTVRGATGNPNDVVMNDTNLGPMFYVASNNNTIRDLKFINAEVAVFPSQGDTLIDNYCGTGGSPPLLGSGGATTISNCTFDSNTTITTNGTGGAFIADTDTTTHVDRCGFFNNTAIFGIAVATGFAGTDPTQIHISNSIFSGKKAVNGPAIVDGLGGAVLLLLLRIPRDRRHTRRGLPPRDLSS